MRTVLLLSLLVAGLAGCGGGDEDSADAAGAHPFSQWDRCYVDYDDTSSPPGEENIPDDAPRPGCSHDGEQSLLSTGATLTSRDGDEAMFDVTYRGGYTQRGDTTESANPEYIGIVAAFDVTVRYDGSLPLGSQGFDDLSVSAFRGGASQGSSTLEPCSTTAVLPTGYDHYIEQGETVTLMYCFYSAGPPNFLDGDPYLGIRATSRNGSPGYAASFAVDETLPVSVLSDVRSSIDLMAEIKQLDGYDWGAAAFERRYGDVTEDFVTNDRRGEGAESEATESAEQAETVAPPPPPPTDEESEPEAEETTEQADDPEYETGNLHPVLFDSTEELMADRLPDDADYYLDCSVAGSEKPCIEIVLEDAGDHTSSEYEASVGVRYTVTGDPGWRDVYLLLTSETGEVGDWEIHEEWQTGPMRPSWAG